MPPPAADSACVQTCQQNHTACLGTTTPPAAAYGEQGAALIGGMIQLAISQSGRSRCAEVLQSCYATCGQPISQQQANLADVCHQLRCEDGTPGLWLGRARTLGLEVGIATYMCRTDTAGHIGGQWACTQVMPGVGCVSDGGVLDGAVQGDTLRMTSAPLQGRVSRCDFTAHTAAPLVLDGTYSCSGAIGTTTGSFTVTRCP